ncbi:MULTISPECIES: ABC transporter permease [Dethiosulfovibrio]|uniref:Proline/glycine betaine ABC transporter permease n=2 Tax=Dethiosulfovibrio TaxID=47054 RepID=A0ABS9EP13_9BACT|nr:MULTISPECIES: proline/glycine betaine ABC transporter permease [Dethiosulfovibrio]MCF4114406.1 proline/glycine betaine ABC transporter permease [Dethiosulfovibrio russensis]MCF4142933.1 proline/glycine betaine ABC transporter permease [Dethiosulfovibrio marinus]MCF4145030.1 proline/glycine betaine ABC transporter permease [Dethiosulfovibrio acidaminovorans]
MFPDAWEFHVAQYVNDGVDWLLVRFAPAFDSISVFISSVLSGIQSSLEMVPWWAYIIAVALGVWLATGKKKSAVILAAFTFCIGLFGLWGLALETLSIIITSVLISLLLGIPLGVMTAEFPRGTAFMKPLLDGMQTMPSFVYLIPAMMFFGLGKVPAVFATLIYSMPPVIRLTTLGLRQVPKPAQEAAIAYGATRWQLLKEVRLPLAMPGIMAGINQTTMMALAMVVVCAMIGARGLGQEVLLSINRIDIGRGFESGISIVIMAIVIDRITQGLGKRWEPKKRQ